MKRKVVFSLSLLLSALMLVSCAAPAPGGDEQFEAKLPVTGGIDWNACSPSMFGTGKTTATIDTLAYTSDGLTETLTESYTEDEWKVEINIQKLVGLVDKTMQESINARISELSEAFKARTFTLDDGSPITGERSKSFYAYPSVVGNLLCINTGMYVWSAVGYYMDESHNYIFDLSTGKELTLSDMFKEETDFHALLNPIIAKQLNSSELSKRPFKGLPDNFNSFSVDSQSLLIMIPGNNPFWDYEYMCYVSIPLNDISAHLAQPFDTPLKYLSFEPGAYENYWQPSDTIKFTAYHFYIFGDVRASALGPLILSGVDEPLKSKINNQMTALYDEMAQEELPIDTSTDPSKVYFYTDGLCAGTKRTLSFMVSLSISQDDEYSQYQLGRCFDRETGEPLSLADVIVDAEGLNQYTAEQFDYLIPNPQQNYNFTIAQGALWLYSPENQENMYIPLEYVKEEMVLQ